jgi:hypothetical protein
MDEDFDKSHWQPEIIAVQPKERAPAKEYSPQQMEAHLLTNHAEYESWCEHCVFGQGPGSHHRKQPAAGSEIPVFKLDYSGMGDGSAGTNLFPDGTAKADVVKVLGGHCRDIDAILSMQVTTKGPTDRYAVGATASYLERKGYKSIALQTDNEPSIRAFVRAVKAKCSCDIMLRASPAIGDSSALAGGETVQRIVAGKVRSMFSLVKEKTGYEIQPSDNAVPWAVRMAGWSRERFKTAPDGSTCYSRTNGASYKGEVAHLYEVVMVKVPNETNKFKS